MNQSTMVWAIPLLPLAGFLFQVLVGRRCPKIVVSVVSCGVVAVSAILAWNAFFHLQGLAVDKRAIIAELGRWISIPGTDEKGALAVSAAGKLVVDPLTAVMILVVTNIGFLIHLYSTSYMAEEKRFSRYFAFLNLFTAFMLILVMAGNMLLMFVGWEGVGLCSYLLIGFWFEKKENAVAGMKAFLVNRVGDLGFTIGLLTLFVFLGTTYGKWTVDFTELRAVIEQNKGALMGSGVITFIALMLFVGATGKSAQIPLFVWLPDAMAGPTPVSALIHAATMVTAGVYMIARLNFLYVLSPAAMTAVAFVGALTALFAGTIGIAQNDIKKVLAYSTVSQLGFMFMGVGVGAFAAGIFHLFTHAFFKACLFLGSGSVIHGMGGEQDIRKMGGLKSKMKVTFITFAVASAAIAGVPGLSGFFSKDEILWRAWDSHLPLPGWVLWGMGFTAAGCTAFYMARLVIKTFLGKPQWQAAGAMSGGGVGLPDDRKKDEPGDLPQDESLLDLGKMGHAVRAQAGAHDAAPPAAPDAGHGGGHGHHGEPHESPWPMLAALILLSIGSVVVGFLGVPAALGGHDSFGHWLEPVTGKIVHGDAHLIEYVLMALSVLVGLGGIAAAFWVYVKREGRPAAAFAARNPETYQLVLEKYRVDEIYEALVIDPLLAANERAGRFDNKIVDGAVNGSAWAGVRGSTGIGIVDNDVVDGAVNAAAAATQAAGRRIRRLQTGNIREYIMFALVGGLFVIAFFCVYWSDKFMKLIGGQS